MNEAELMKTFFTMLMYHLPTLAISLAAVIVTIVKWKQAPLASVWAFLGFGMIFSLSIIMPVVHTAIQYWMLHAEDPASQSSRAWLMGIVGIVSALLYAISNLFLLFAVFTGRAKPAQNPADYQS